MTLRTETALGRSRCFVRRRDTVRTAERSGRDGNLFKMLREVGVFYQNSPFSLKEIYCFLLRRRGKYGTISQV